MQHAKARPDAGLRWGRLELGSNLAQKLVSLILLERPAQREQNIHFFGRKTERHWRLQAWGCP
jgi:hypothetical protein